MQCNADRNARDVGDVDGLDHGAAFFLVPHECVYIRLLQVGRVGLARGELEPAPLHNYIHHQSVAIRSGWLTCHRLCAGLFFSRYPS